MNFHRNQPFQKRTNYRDATSKGKNRATLLSVQVGSVLLENRVFREVPYRVAIKTILSRIARKQLSQVCDN
jgi:hypothetical protein